MLSMIKQTDSERARAAIAKMHENLQKVSTPKVLLVDDNKDDAFVFSHTLSKEYPHVQLMWKTNGEEAVASIGAFHFDLVILDLMFGGATNGVDIFKAMRHKQHVPTVALTGLDWPAELIKDAMDAGIEVVFRKPLSKESLDLLFSAP